MYLKKILRDGNLVSQCRRQHAVHTPDFMHEQINKIKNTCSFYRLCPSVITYVILTHITSCTSTSIIFVSSGGTNFLAMRSFNTLIINTNAQNRCGICAVAWHPPEWWHLVGKCFRSTSLH